MVGRKCFFVFCLLLFVFPLVGDEERPLSKEDLLFQEIPVVISASRKEQKVTEAPAAVTVITREDIRYSGAFTIPDLLRSVAGVDVMTISARDEQVGIRGFNRQLANKVLVLLDGRSVTEDFYGNVLWHMIPVGLEEIERIEVLKSPSSSVYGSGAFSGVINIISKTPEQVNGTAIKIKMGSKKNFAASFLHGGSVRQGAFKYKISGERDATGDWDKTCNAGIVHRVNGMMEYKPGDDFRLSLSAGLSAVSGSRVFADEFIGSGELTTTVSYIKADADYKKLKFRTFLKVLHSENDWRGELSNLEWTVTTYDAELFYTFKFGKGHSLLAGCNYRHITTGKNTMVGEGVSQHRFAFFFEDEITLSPKLRFVLGGRRDYHPLTHGHFSPRANLFYSPGGGHVIRLSFSRAHLNPALATSYLYAQETVMMALEDFPRSIEVPMTIRMTGDPGLHSESIISFELGVYSPISKKCNVTLNLFYHLYDHFIRRVNQTVFYGAGELFPGSPGGFIPKIIDAGFSNSGSSRGIGGEVGVKFSFSRAVSGFINYAYLQVIDEEDEPSTYIVNEKDRARESYPTHKINVGLRVLFPFGLSFNTTAHWVDGTRRLVVGDTPFRYFGAVNDYLIINARAGYSFLNHKAELSLEASNLMNNKHYEFPPSPTSRMQSSFRIGRKVSLNLRYRF